MGIFSLDDAIEKIEDKELKEEILYQLKRHDEELREGIIAEYSSINDCDGCDRIYNLESEIDYISSENSELDFELSKKKDQIKDIYDLLKNLLSMDTIEQIKVELNNVLPVIKAENDFKDD